MTADPTAGPVRAPKPLRILVIDDHPLFCDALSMVLPGAFAEASVRSVNRLSEAIEAVRSEGAPEIVLLDLNLPDADGLDGLMRLRAGAPAAKVVVVSSIAENRMIAAALRAGAAGFIPKDSPRGELIAALRRVWAGETWVPPDYDAPDEVGNGAEDEARILERMATLTPQQGRILELVCAGKLNKQIAWDLSISETTVKAHVTAILRKLGVRSRTQAVLVAQKTRFASILNEPPARD